LEKKMDLALGRLGLMPLDPMKMDELLRKDEDDNVSSRLRRCSGIYGGRMKRI